MKHPFLALFFILIVFGSASAQEDINKYKYIVVPNTYQFLKGKDQYQVNSLTKFLFNKYGYKAYMEGVDYPADLTNNPCLALTADAEEVKGGFLITKLQFNLKDCRGNVVATSQVGKSKDKEFKAAYHEAIREAFQTFQDFDYNYKQPVIISVPMDDVEPEESTPTITMNQPSETELELERLKKEVEELKAKKVEKEVKKDAAEQAADQIDKKAMASKSIATEEKVKPETVPTEKIEWLYAQPIENGFQVVDTEPKKVMILLNSGRPNMYMVEGKDAIVYKEGDEWFYSETKETGPEVKKIHLKF